MRGLIFNLKKDIEMGRLITGADNPVVLYVSGGNTQVNVIFTFSSCLVILHLLCKADWKWKYNGLFERFGRL